MPILLAGAALCFPAPARTATASSSIPVSVSIVSSCSFSAAPMAFGSYTGAVINATTTLTVTCTSTTPYQIGADNGLNSAYVGVYAKYMLGPSGNKLRYHLYPDAAHSVEWGTTPGSNEVAGTGTGAAQTITVYGSVGGGSLGYVPGAYGDTVTLTLTF